MLKLQFKDQRKAAIWLVDSRYAIGRDKSNDIVIDEDGISGFHAELRVEDDDRIFLTDAGSINGTFVNGERISAAAVLRSGDHLHFGPEANYIFYGAADIRELDLQNLDALEN